GEYAITLSAEGPRRTVNGGNPSLRTATRQPAPICPDFAGTREMTGISAKTGGAFSGVLTQIGPYPPMYPQKIPACNGTRRNATDEKKPGSLDFLGFPGFLRNIPEVFVVAE
ncbi:MAG TPA: hypothetical protein PKD04_09905, partial [Rhodocyclaceae bacterium]|nr:hypothetical protein [Rhodocyclaceae bacterium]